MGPGHGLRPHRLIGDHLLMLAGDVGDVVIFCETNEFALTFVLPSALILAWDFGDVVIFFENKYLFGHCF